MVLKKNIVENVSKLEI